MLIFLKYVYTPHNVDNLERNSGGIALLAKNSFRKEKTKLRNYSF